MTIAEAYQILGLRGHPTAREVKRAYRRRAFEWHPDRSGSGQKDIFARKFMEARSAYELLRQAGYPEPPAEPAPDFSPKTAGRRFSPKTMRDAPLAEKLGADSDWKLESLVIWGLLIPAGVLGLWWMLHFLLQAMSP